MALRALVARKSLGLGFQSEAKILAVGSAAHSRGFQTFSLPDLPYDYGALEPAISGEIMQLHHQKHHQTYVTNYNKALEQLHDAIAKGDAAAVVKLQSAIKFNGGGHVNHSIFWKNLTPVSHGGGEPPHGSLGWAIDTNFGSMEALVQKINAEGAALQGSGWVWLALDKELKKLVVETTANQDPLVTKGPTLVPLLGIDVWEHAYYLQYKNVRPEYLKNIWKVINWKYASETFKRRNGGRNKHGRGHVKFIRCSNCGKCCLSKLRLEMSRKLVSMSNTLCQNCMPRCSTAFPAQFTLTFVRVRSRTNRRNREPPQRFIRRRDDAPRPGQPGQGPRPAGAPVPART
ncbi:hypothetical protein GBA52_006532 [Prunus armeniaca]|nr:hypothetical protein GBA52_006532 [Prunus armeniaca]